MATATKPEARRREETPSSRAGGRAPDKPHAHSLPVMRVTRYDRVSSGMIALVLGLILAVIGIVVWWYTTRPAPEQVLVPLEIMATGGYEDGSPDETLNVESPEEEIPNASPVEEQIDDLQIEEALDTVVELSDRATEQMETITADDAQTGGTPGSMEGTGGRPLGEGGGPGGGVPAEQRWFVRFAEDGSLDVYARQLDAFGIELGIVFPQRGELIYLSNLSRNPPSQRTVKTGENEERLYMTWQGGQRKDADTKLIERAGIDTTGGIIFHFYPRETEQLLLRLERSYANRSPREIRRTYFVVIPQGNSFTFAVTRQQYFR